MEYVDLGLPSGKLWMRHLLGMNSDTDVHNALYFQWGSEKGYRKDEENDFSRDNCDYNKTEWSLFGYNVKLPSKEDFRELLDNTERKVETIDGVKGMLFTSKSNGTSLFIPFIGCRYCSRVYDVSDSVDLWSSSLYVHDHYYAVGLSASGDGYASIDSYGRFGGYGVLGIKTNNKESSDFVTEKTWNQNLKK